jgi:3-oxoacyl-[acyl-carrier-protein] synthase-3
MAIALGDANTAVSTGSEKLSAMMESSKFDGELDNTEELDKNGYIAFEKDFLRYMLSDGAAAALLSDKPNEDGFSFQIDWIDMTSYSNELETCMYAGCFKDENGEVISWKDVSEMEWLRKSIFAVKQDTRILGQFIVPKGIDFLQQIIAKRNLDLSVYNYFLPHLSSEFFRNEIDKGLKARGLSIPSEIWFTNLHKVGNVGSASPFLMLEELLYSGKLKTGEKILMMVPESARFSYAYLQLTVV